MTDTTPAAIRAWALRNADTASNLLYADEAALFRAVAALVARAEPDSEGGWRRGRRSGMADLTAFSADTPDGLFVVGYSEGRPPILGHVNRYFTKMFGLAGEVAVLDRRRGRWRACTHYVAVPEPTSEKDATDG